MKTRATLYGDGGNDTYRAAEALTKSGLVFRVCFSPAPVGSPTLSMPFGELRGLEGIRSFAERAAAQRDQSDQLSR